MESTRGSTGTQACSAGLHRREGAVNVGDVERVASILIGGGMALGGLRRIDSLRGLGLALLGGGLVYRGISGHCGLYRAWGWNTSRAPQTAVPAHHGTRVERSIVINAEPEQVYRFWRQLDNLPRFVNHIKEVRPLEGTRSHWVAEGPLGVAVEWDAEIVNDKPGELIAWRSLDGWQVDTAGSVHFHRDPHGRGTEVRVELKYDPPGGQVGIFLAHLLGDAPDQQLAADLFRLKRIMEAGEASVPTGQPVSQAHQAMQGAARRELAPNSQDRIEETSAESFPASDAPGWTTSAASTQGRKG